MREKKGKIINKREKEKDMNGKKRENTEAKKSEEKVKRQRERKERTTHGLMHSRNLW